MSEMLAFEGVSLVLGGTRVLDRIDLHIGAAERVAIVGESGAGKGWLLRLAVGLAEPGSGMVRLMGVALDERIPTSAACCAPGAGWRCRAGRCWAT